MAQGQSRLELLPREIRDMIYECLGVATCKRELDFEGVKVSCRHVAQADDCKLRIYRADEFDTQERGKPTIDATAVMALASTQRVLHAEITELLFEYVVMLIELDEV
jgi:hypothetical protein